MNEGPRPVPGTGVYYTTPAGTQRGYHQGIQRPRHHWWVLVAVVLALLWAGRARADDDDDCDSVVYRSAVADCWLLYATPTIPKDRTALDDCINEAGDPKNPRYDSCEFNPQLSTGGPEPVLPPMPKIHPSR